MNEREKPAMDIPLHPDIERFVHEQLDGQRYAAPEEVVTEALFLLWQRDCLPAEGREQGGSGVSLERQAVAALLDALAQTPGDAATLKAEA